MKLLARVGKKVRKRRIALNLSQREVAKQSGILQSEISRIEGGTANITIATLHRLCKTLDLRIRIENKEDV